LFVAAPSSSPPFVFGSFGVEEPLPPPPPAAAAPGGSALGEGWDAAAPPRAASARAAASPAPAPAPAPAAPAPAWALPPPPAAAAAGGAGEGALSLEGGGLRNALGEYNCFLNALLQALWHCGRSFRPALAAAPPPAGRGAEAEVARALRALLGSMSEAAAARALTPADPTPAQAAAAAAAARRAGGLNPAPLRLALAALSPATAQAGAMADSAEVLGLLLEAVHRSHSDPGRSGGASPVAACFEFGVREAAACTKCGVVTHELRYTARCHVVAAAALRAHSGRGLEEALRGAQSGDIKSCDSEHGGCGAPVLARHTLGDAPLPPLFALALGWESRRAPPAALAATLACLAPALRPQRAFAARAGDAADGGARYALRSLVCFVGAHYVVLCRPGEAAGSPWLLFNDAQVSVVGEWPQLLAACERDGLQPCICIYEREE